MNHVKNRARKIGNGIAKIGRWLITPASPEEIPYTDLQPDNTMTLLDVTGGVGILAAPNNSRVGVTPVGTHLSGANAQTIILTRVKDMPHQTPASKPEPPQPPKLTLYHGSVMVSQISRSRTDSSATKRAASMLLSGTDPQAVLAGLMAFVEAHPVKSSRTLAAVAA